MNVCGDFLCLTPDAAIIQETPGCMSSLRPGEAVDENLGWVAGARDPGGHEICIFLVLRQGLVGLRMWVGLISVFIVLWDV